MRLQAKLLLLLLPVVVAPILVLGLTSFRQLTDSVTAHTFGVLTALGDRIAQDFGHLEQTAATNVRLLAAYPAVTQFLLTEGEELRDFLLHGRLVDSLARFQAAYPDHYELRLLDPDGRELARRAIADLPSAPEDASGVDFFPPLRDLPPEKVFSALTRNSGNHQWALVVGKPIYLVNPALDPPQARSELRGYLLVTVRLDRIVRTVKLAQVGTEIELTLTTADGQIVYATDGGVAGSRLGPRQLTRLREGAAVAPVRVTGDGRPRRYEQVFRLHPDLYLITVLTEEAVLGDSRPLGLVVGLITLIAVVAVAALLIMGLRRMVLQPVARLRTAVRRIGEGHLSEPVTADHRDELGELAAAFERMRVRLLASYDSIGRYQAELEEKVTTTEQAVRAKTEFLARMSHEIRTPLNGILGVADLLAQTALSARQRQLTATIERSGNALLAVINDILDFSKIEAGHMSLNEAVFDLYTLVEEIVELFGERGYPGGLEFIGAIDPHTPRQVRGDPARLRQILMNLVGNAAKFTEAGQVVVQVGPDPERPGRVWFEVEDSGTGMRPELHEQVFDSFQQGDGSTTRRFPGTGLGLTIARDLVRLMEGEILVSSQPNVGSCFRFDARLPAVDGAQGLSVPELQAARVLLLAAHFQIGTVIERQLAALGCTVTTVADAREAVRVLTEACREQRTFDLCLLDEPAPGRSGLGTAWRSLCAHPTLARSRLVLLGSATDAAPDHLSDLGFAAQISKPLLTTRLAAGLARAMRVPAPPHLPAPGPGAAAMPALAGGVLVATSNALDRVLLRDVLVQLGSPPNLASDTQSASAQLREGTFELVLLDCLLLEGGGLALARELRRDRADHRPAIVGLLTEPVGLDRQSCLEAGMDDVLEKPFSPQRIQDMARRWLDPSRRPAGHDAPAAVAANAPAGPEIRELEALPLLDSEVLATLGALAKPDKPDLLERILTAYRRDAAGNLEKLRTAVRQADAMRIYQAAHSLKSASGNVGAQRLAAAARALEVCSRQGRNDEVAPLLARLEREFQALSAELETRRLAPVAQRRG